MDLKSLKYRLTSITGFHFKTATNQVLNGWEGEGIGTVKTVWENDHSLLFFEEGRFTNSNNKSMKCSNIYRWAFDENNDKIGLQHLRFGIDKPVFLFDLIFQSETQLISACPHLCSKDLYQAKMSLQENIISLEWLIEKPNSSNTIAYQYN
jgi:hypothetical protein